MAERECKLYQVSKQLVNNNAISDIAAFYSIPSDSYKTWEDLLNILRGYCTSSNREKRGFISSDHSMEFLFGYIKKAALNCGGFCVQDSNSPDNSYFVFDHGGTILADFNFEERPKNIFDFGILMFLDTVSYIINLGLPSE